MVITVSTHASGIVSYRIEEGGDSVMFDDIQYPLFAEAIDRMVRPLTPEVSESRFFEDARYELPY